MLEPKITGYEFKEETQVHPEDMNLDELFDVLNGTEFGPGKRVYLKLYFVRKNGDRYGWSYMLDYEPLAINIKVGDHFKAALYSELRKNGRVIYPSYITKVEYMFARTKVKTMYTDCVVEGDPRWILNKDVRRYSVILEVP